MKKLYKFNDLSDVTCLGCPCLLKKINALKGYRRCYQCYINHEKNHGHIIAGQTKLTYLQSSKRRDKGIVTFRR